LGITRRSFLMQSAMAAARLAGRESRWPLMANSSGSPRFEASSLSQFVDPLPVLPRVPQVGYRPSPENAGVKLPYFRVVMHQFEAKIHRDLKPTRVWGFGSNSPGPILEMRAGEGVLVEWINELPTRHLFTIDHNIHGAEAGQPDVRAVVHLHGSRTGPANDGYPEHWYAPGKSVVCHYPNGQEPAMLWYHDHALGINRLNMFAGLFGVSFVRDEFEDSLNLPRDNHELPLVLYDRIFDVDGQLAYPVGADPKARWVPEVLGDAILVNGKLYPYIEVEARKYRLRILNGANARSFHLTFSTTVDQQWFTRFHLIGSDQGLLSAPVEATRVRLAPAERADLIFDFSRYAGTRVVLRNDNFNVMEFRVSARSSRDESTFPKVLRPVRKLSESDASKTRILTLDEIDDPARRPVMNLLNNTRWNMPVTENPTLDSIEIWNFVNLTDDDHPIHLHLVRFQILDRRPFSVYTYKSTGQLKYTGSAVPPEPGEAGWKDTVRAQHGTVTRIIIRFEGFTGRFVWHCHILEHEDNEMMRPFDVVGTSIPHPPSLSPRRG